MYLGEAFSPQNIENKAFRQNTRHQSGKSDIWTRCLLYKSGNRKKKKNWKKVIIQIHIKRKEQCHNLISTFSAFNTMVKLYVCKFLGFFFFCILHLKGLTVYKFTPKIVLIKWTALFSFTIIYIWTLVRVEATWVNIWASTLKLIFLNTSNSWR